MHGESAAPWELFTVALVLFMAIQTASADDRYERSWPLFESESEGGGDFHLDAPDDSKWIEFNKPAPPINANPVSPMPPTSDSFELPPVAPGDVFGKSASGVLAKDFVFHGNTVVTREELLRVIGPMAGRALTAPQLEDLRQAITRYYVDKGYINSGALLPDEYYRDGIVHFQIIEGRIDKLTLRGMGYLREFYARNRLIEKGEVFNANVLQERFRRLLNDPLFARVNARLEPTGVPGLANLEVDVTRARPWEVSALYNNYRSPSTGSESGGIAFTLRNLTSLGDTFDFRVQGRGAPNTLYGADWSVPVYYPDTQLHARYDYGRSVVIEEPLDTLDVKSILESKEAGLSHTFVNTLSREFSVNLSYLARKNSTYLLGQPFSFVAGEATGISKVNAWRFDQDFTQRWERGALALRSAFTRGHTNTVGSDKNPLVIAPDHYLFWLGQLQASWRVLDKGGDLVLRMSGQWSRDRLVALERFSAGGVHSVRGYRENQLVRDKGFTSSLEFRYPLFDNPASRHRLTLVPFMDYAVAMNLHERSEELASVGLGAVWNFKGLSAELYYGHKLITPTLKSSGNLQDHGIHFQVRYAYQ